MRRARTKGGGDRQPPSDRLLRAPSRRTTRGARHRLPGWNTPIPRLRKAASSSNTLWRDIGVGVQWLRRGGGGTRCPPRQFRWRSLIAAYRGADLGCRRISSASAAHPAVRTCSPPGWTVRHRRKAILCQAIRISTCSANVTVRPGRVRRTPPGGPVTTCDHRQGSPNSNASRAAGFTDRPSPSCAPGPTRGWSIPHSSRRTGLPTAAMPEFLCRPTVPARGIAARDHPSELAGHVELTRTADTREPHLSEDHLSIPGDQCRSGHRGLPV